MKDGEFNVSDGELDARGGEPGACRGDAQTFDPHASQPPLPGPLSAELRARSAAMRRVHEALLKQTDYLMDEQ